MQTPFIGSEAVAAGRVRKHQLRSRFTPMFPDIYTDQQGDDRTLYHRAMAAWLWSRRGGVVAGLTAAALHGAKYVEDNHPIELAWSGRRPPPGIVTHKVQLGTDDVVVRGGLPFTSVERTAFDVGRRGTLDEAITRLDALGNATGFGAESVLQLASRHCRPRGMRQLVAALELYDPGAESPPETLLRLLLIRAGYPRPATQIAVRSADGRRQYFLDIGWEKYKLAVEYDGDHHRTDPRQFAHDILRSEDLDELRWTRVRVVKRHHENDVLARVARAWAAAGAPPILLDERAYRSGKVA
ncbi:hypothetical protein BOO86_09415 [Mycobacterium sp. CBMA 234]|uniref:hypothetical protein n=1 Tax=Mycolicibacterium sp. CBMA 234 TaxID=1918495 RepID=UPI0012DEBC2C|nr:hypothetical protein [Mycolicibacterium sp. CBMA 234]MUL64677.1 hypothetical protein [Mycolicibacterium sp. CBMA 234]